VGILYHDAKRLWQARLAGVKFDRVLTLGRLQLFLHPAEVRALREAFRANPPFSLAEPLVDYQFGEFADRFLREFCGVTTLETLDYSAYEGATLVHDMNAPIADEFKGRFDVVIEGGSLEHIFNFPVAIKNLMQLVRLGGMAFLTMPANNLCGHGFYQFSPELIFRIFSKENGFEETRVVFLDATFPGVELTPIRRAYEVTDPASVGRRVGLKWGRPTIMAVEARKASDLEPFAESPQQSDYSAAWNRSKQLNPRAGSGLLRRLAKRLPDSWQYRLQGYYWNWQYSLRNRNFYRKIE
jgi:SAM-dependent methyltransferase